jgi:hypothetical protein
MGGFQYTVRSSRTSAAVSLVAGVAFNRVSANTDRLGDPLPVDAGNSFAWRPGLSVWRELGPRVAFNVFSAYLFTRPRTTFLEDDRLIGRTIRADTALVKVGLAYKVF